MSLNGLDNPTVKEVHETAVTEPGGWFLLKYASRDEVDVYSRGTSGIVEMRNAIANYEESSPLYGFLKYRRRNVILKYLPDDCSRLVQARATVHFNAVCERFTPYNTTFEITDAKELKDTKLSAACSLHAASGSSSSSTSSLRRRRLMEITEEEEEEERERKRQSIVQEEERPSTAGDTEFRTPLSSPERPAVLDREQIHSPKEPNFASTAEKPSFGDARPTSPTKSEYEPRLSSQTTRPDLYSYSSYPYGKPRVKLGPRPSLEANKKPHTASNFRPVAALPAGFKVVSKGSKKGRSGSQDQTAEGEDQDQDQEHEEETEGLEPLSSSATIPEAPQESEVVLLPPRPNTSSGASLKSISSIAPTKESKMTPEKARLMKAMKLRQQKKTTSLMVTEPATANLPSDMDNGMNLERQVEEPDTTNDLETLEKEEQHILPLSHADSASAVDPPTPMTVDTEVTEDTFTDRDSHPSSPTVASSEIGESTKASSLSESTDETVQPTKDVEPEQDSDIAKPIVHDVDNADKDATLTSSAHVDELHNGAQDVASVLVEDDVPIVQESDIVPQKSRGVAESTQNEIDRESIENSELRVETSDIKSQEVVLPPPQDDEVASPKSPYGIPMSRFASNDSKSPTTPSLKSRFSTQDLKAPSELAPSLPALVTPPVFAAAGPSPEPIEEAEQDEVLTSAMESIQTKNAKRNLSISPINTELTKKTSESETHDPLHDDDLMDELQSATFEEAQPMRFSKSPITSVFPSTSPKRPQTVGSNAPLTRAFSNPMRGPLLVPGDVSSSSARSVSAGGAALLHNITRQPSNAGLSTKKPTGGSIAQRIKALQQLSGESSPDTDKARPRTAGPSTSFVSVRHPSVRDSSRSPIPTLADRASSLTRQTPTPDLSREGSPDLLGGLKPPRSRAGSMAKRMSMFETATPPSRGRPESIQVTARIVRDGNASFPKRPSSKDPAEYNTTDLKQSPLVVDHLKAVPEPVRAHTFDVASLPTIETPKDTIQERRQSRDRKASVSEDEVGKKRRSSLSIVKDFIKDRRSSVTSDNKSTDNLAILSPAPSSRSPSRPPSVHQTSGGSLGRRLSISSRRSSVSKEHESSTPLVSPAPTIDNSSNDTDKASLGEKKSQSRTSRFMRRLSNSFVATRKSATPNTPTTVREEEEVLPEVSAAHSHNPSQPALAAYMGDVNVQFPDNLLWKRRSMCLDTHGFLMLSPINNGTEKTGVSTKRFHMTDFRTPYIPDVDMQELPNSICLDFVQGSALQLACEDRQGQIHTLNALQEAHHKHSSFGQ